MGDDIKTRVSQAIESRVFPGCVVGVIDNGRRTVLPFGRLAYKEESATVGEDTVYDVASVTKSIPLASIVLQLIDEGTLSLSDSVQAYLPRLQHHYGASIEDLLRYRVHGLRLSELKNNTVEEIRTRVLESGFDGPAAQGAYTNLPAYLLGMVVEKVEGVSLAAIAEKRFFGPLNMSKTTFFPSRNDCAPTEVSAEGDIRGVPHDESAQVFARARRSAGHAGLFSTASDLLNYLEALLGGAYPSIVRGAKNGLGWQVHEDYFMGTRVSSQAFGKTGFTGCSVLCDTGRGIALVILSNRTYPKRPADAFSPTSAINEFRSTIADIVLGTAL